MDKTLSEAYPVLGWTHPLIQSLSFVEDLIADHGNIMETLRKRKAELESQVREALDKSAGSAARETPGASTEQRT